MSTDSNRSFVRKLVEEEWNKGNLEAVDQYVASDFVHHDPANPTIVSREDYKQWIVATRTAFPDFHITIDDELAEGEQVVARWTVQGTHQGEFVGPMGTIPPTGKQINIQGITITRCADGRVVEDWHLEDAIG